MRVFISGGRDRERERESKINDCLNSQSITTRMTAPAELICAAMPKRRHTDTGTPAIPPESHRPSVSKNNSSGNDVVFRKTAQGSRL